MLGETTVGSTHWHKSAFLTFHNSTIAYADGQFLMQDGSRSSTIHNNHIHHMSWSCVGETSGKNHALLNANNYDQITQNTMHDYGLASGIHTGIALVELNLIHDTYVLQNDGALVQMHGDPAGHCIRNWAFNTVKRGYRYDRPNNPHATYAEHGILWGNIGWNTSAAFVKGDHHNITANMHWYPVKGSDLIVLGPGETPYAFDFENTHTVVERNGAQSMGCGKNNHSFAGPSANNIEAVDIRSQLRDIDNRDFRPKPGSDSTSITSAPTRRMEAIIGSLVDTSTLQAIPFQPTGLQMFR